MLNTIIEDTSKAIRLLPAIDANTLSPSDRDFLQAICAKRPSIIAELKPASPSEGALAQDYDPAKQAKAYAEGGAAALSILTNTTYFSGSFSDLAHAHAATHLPTLCKDFIIDCQQIYHARQAGADACLLIVSALTDAKISLLKDCIESLRMLAVIEVHTLSELKRALSFNPKLILINNRNLHTLAMHPETTEQLIPYIPETIPIISASGFSNPAAVQRVSSRIQALLIGTALMKAAEPTKFLKQIQHYLEKNK